MDEADKLLALLRHRRAAAELDATMAQLDIDAGKARLKAARAQLTHIDRMIEKASPADRPLDGNPVSGAGYAGAATEHAPAFPRRGRPPKQSRADAQTLFPLTQAQPDPTADEIRRKRLARRGQSSRSKAEGNATGTRRAEGDGAAAAATSATARPERPGGVRATLLAVLQQTADDGPLALDDIHKRMQDITAGKAVKNSIRTMLFGMKREGLVTGEAGKWALARRQ